MHGMNNSIVLRQTNDKTRSVYAKQMFLYNTISESAGHDGETLVLER